MLFRLIFVFIFTTTTVFAEKTELNAQQWLERMSRSMKELNFQGTVAFFKNGRLDTMNYSHTRDKGVEQEKLLSLNSPMREVVREAGKVSCVFRDTKQVVVNQRPVSQSFIVDLPIDFSTSNLVYHFNLLGEESVAMLPTRVVSIKAKDKYRYDRKIWIDIQHFLPLKIEVYSLTGETLEQVVFTDLKVGLQVEFKKADSQSNKPKIKKIQEVQSSSFEQADFVLNNIPLGFESVFFTKMKVENSANPVDHLLLSDGFSSISVYHEAKSEDIQLGPQKLGSVNSFTHLIDYSQITAMGEVPAKTVQFIAQGIKFK